MASPSLPDGVRSRSESPPAEREGVRHHPDTIQVVWVLDPGSGQQESSPPVPVPAPQRLDQSEGPGWYVDDGGTVHWGGRRGDPPRQ